MSPTTTDRLPPVIACASGTCIWRMSHCSGENVSASAAGALGSGPSPGSPESAAGSSSLEAKRAVDDAPSTRPSRPIAAAKPALSERAIATPIWS